MLSDNRSELTGTQKLNHKGTKTAVLHKFAKIDMHRSISATLGKMSKIDSYQHRGSELRNTAQRHK
jgi:hypothetical protein